MKRTPGADQKGRGTSAAHSPAIHLRLPPTDLARLDAWRGAQPEPQPSRPEAIRRLLDHVLAGGGPRLLTDEQRLARAHRKAATPVPDKPSPARGVAMLKRGKAEAALAALKAKKAR